MTSDPERHLPLPGYSPALTYLALWAPVAPAEMLNDAVRILIAELTGRGDAQAQRALSKLSDALDDSRRSRLESELLAAIRAELAETDLDDDDDDAPITEITSVKFTTWEWDNGWFFQENDATLTGTGGATIPHFSFVTELVINLLSDLAGVHALGRDAVLTVDLADGDVSVERD